MVDEIKDENRESENNDLKDNKIKYNLEEKRSVRIGSILAIVAIMGAGCGILIKLCSESLYKIPVSGSVILY